MGEIWRFIVDNRDTLGWLGGGVVVVAGGLWTVVKFFVGRQKRESSPNVRADRGSVAIGRDATNSPININTRDPATNSKKR